MSYKDRTCGECRFYAFEDDEPFDTICTKRKGKSPSGHFLLVQEGMECACWRFRLADDIREENGVRECKPRIRELPPVLPGMESFTKKIEQT